MEIGERLRMLMRAMLPERWAASPDAKSFTPASDVDWTYVNTLVHGPGASSGGSAAGDGNSAVFACLMAIALAYPEPPVRVYRRRGGREYAIPDHPLHGLLDRPTPNGELSMADMWFWTAWAKHVDGNAYWLKVRSGDALRGNVVELWPVSPSLIRPVTRRDPRGRPLAWISYYKMRTGPGPNDFEEVPIENVIHFRLGVDDRDMRLGLAPLKRLVREISSDQEATKFTDALLKNYAVPGLVVIPDDSGESYIDRPGADRIKATFRENFSNDNRGNVAVLSSKATVEQFGFSPEQLNMGILHQVPEERISAVIGVPAIIAGLGAGLARSTFANFREAREMLTEQRFVPLWRLDEATLNSSLKPDFTTDRNISVRFDLTDVRALQEDEDKKYTRLNLGVQGRWILRNEARADVGLEPIPGWDEEDTGPPPPPPAPPAPAEDATAEEDETAENQEGEKRLPFGLAPLPGAGRNGFHSKASARQLTARKRQVRERAARRAERAIDGWFEDVARAVAAAGRSRASITVPMAKALTAAEWARLVGRILGQQEEALEGIIETHLVAVMAETWPILNIELSEVVQFDANDPLVVEVLRAAGERIEDMTATTLEALRATLPGLYEEGVGTDEIARRVRELVSETYVGRSKAIARTEVGLAENQATSGRYRTAGVRHVRVFDNGFDNSHPFCKRIDGQVVTVEWMERNPLQHPNCVRAFGAVFDYDGGVFTDEERWI